MLLKACVYWKQTIPKSFMIELRGAKSTRMESWIRAQAGNVIKAWNSVVRDPPNKSHTLHCNSAVVPQEAFSILLT